MRWAVKSIEAGYDLELSLLGTKLTDCESSRDGNEIKRTSRVAAGRERLIPRNLIRVPLTSVGPAEGNTPHPIAGSGRRSNSRAAPLNSSVWFARHWPHICQAHVTPTASEVL